MDWIERWFGLSPDNGDGSVEALILFGIAAVVVVGVVTLRKKRPARQPFFMHRRVD
jgi:hypothetical protein